MQREIEIDVGGQVYRFAGHEDCQSAKSGYLTVWESACHDCGAVFQIKRAGPFSKTRLNRRCPAHRKPGIWVGGKA